MSETAAERCPSLQLVRDDAQVDEWSPSPFAPGVGAPGSRLRCSVGEARGARFDQSTVDFARLAASISIAWECAWRQTTTPHEADATSETLAQQLAELKLRVAALEAQARRELALAEAQHRHEESIYAEMRRAGFDPGNLGDDFDPGLSQELWDEVLGEV